MYLFIGVVGLFVYFNLFFFFCGTVLALTQYQKSSHIDIQMNEGDILFYLSLSLKWDKMIKVSKRHKVDTPRVFLGFFSRSMTKGRRTGDRFMTGAGIDQCLTIGL